jgi:hypothetical protein
MASRSTVPKHRHGRRRSSPDAVAALWVIVFVALAIHFGLF